MPLAPRTEALLTVVLALLASSTAAARQQAPAPSLERSDPSGKLRVRLDETQICILDAGMNQDSLVASPDGHHIAYMAMAGQGLCVYVDGKKGENFEGIAFGSLVFSSDGEHMGYVGTRPGKQCVVLDGKIHEYEGVSQQGVVFSPDGQHHGWVAAREGNQFAVIDGQEGPPYDGISPLGIAFSPDSKVSIYVGSSGGKQVVVANGEEGPLYDFVAGLEFPAHGSRVAYVGIRGSESFAVVDGTPYGPFEQLRSTAPRPAEDEAASDAFVMTPDGARFGFMGQRGKQWFTVIDGQERGPYEGCVGLTFSQDGSRSAYLASNGEGWFPVVDGEEVHGNLHQSLSFSPDGKHTAFVVRRSDKQIALIDGVEGKAYDRIEQVLFTADGTKAAYSATLGTDHFVVVNGVESPPFRRPGKIPLGVSPHGASVYYSIRRGEHEVLVVNGVEGPPVQSLRTLSFSADGSRHAYAAEKGPNRWTVVVDGVEHGPGGVVPEGEERTFHSVGKRTPVFSPDGKRFAYSARREDGLYLVAVDGVEGKPYGLVMRGTVDFTPDSAHVVYIAAEGLDGDTPRRCIVVDGVELDNGWTGFLEQTDFRFHGPDRFCMRGSRYPRCLLLEVEITGAPEPK